MIHELEPREGTLHAHFDPSRAPALLIDSGDTVAARTLDVSWGMEPPTSVTAPRKKFEPRDASGPALLGPIGVRGAMPGEALEIQILRCEPSSWGWTYAGKGMGDGALNTVVGVGDELTLMRWEIDHERGVAVNQLGHRVRLRPFLGTLGVSPGGAGVHSGWRPGVWGGNMDCRELVAGTTLFLPVLAPLGLVSLGDGHAAQGDGEVAGTAIECAMERVEIRVVRRPEMKIASPRARTRGGGEGWITMGFGETLDEAARGATAAMVDLIAELRGIARGDAMALASVAVSLGVTQMVNPVRGVHAIFRDDAVTEG